jgi:hypothetical protein
MVTKKLLLFSLLCASSYSMFGMKPVKRCNQPHQSILCKDESTSDSIKVTIMEPTGNEELLEARIETIQDTKGHTLYKVIIENTTSSCLPTIHINPENHAQFFEQMLSQAKADKRKKTYLELNHVKNNKAMVIRIPENDLQSAYKQPQPSHTKSIQPKILGSYINTIPFDKSFTLPHPALEFYKNNSAESFYNSLSPEDQQKYLTDTYNKRHQENINALKKHYTLSTSRNEQTVDQLAKAIAQGKVIPHPEVQSINQTLEKMGVIDAEKPECVYQSLSTSDKVTFLRKNGLILVEENRKAKEQGLALPYPRAGLSADDIFKADKVTKKEWQEYFAHIFTTCNNQNKEAAKKHCHVLLTRNDKTITHLAEAEANGITPYPELQQFNIETKRQNISIEQKATAFYQSLSSKKQKEFLQERHDVLVEENKKAKNAYYNTLATTLKSELEKLDPKNEVKTDELANFIRESFYYCEGNQFLSIDFDAFSNKLVTDIRKKENHLEGQKKHNVKVDTADSLTEKFNEVKRKAGLQMYDDFEFRKNALEETQEINNYTNQRFRTELKMALIGTSLQIGATILSQELAEVAAYGLISCFDHSETTEIITDLKKSITDKEKKLKKHSVKNVSKKCNDELTKQAENNQKIFDQKNDKEITRKELFQKLKDLNENK